MNFGMSGRNYRSNFQPEEPMIGLQPVFGCDNLERRGDVIFVHGIAGHAWFTWHPQDRRDRDIMDFWLTWLGEDLKDAGMDVGIWTFGYEAARFKLSGSAMPLFDQAGNLLDQLESEDGIGVRPIFFITHSMGGLVVKKMLSTAQRFSRDVDKQAIIEQTKGIVFLSTPHVGSDVAKWVTLIDNFIKVQPTDTLKELRAHAPDLRDLDEWYRQYVESLGIATKAYHETKPLHGILIVDPDSANPHIKDVKSVGVDEDHNSIAKPNSRTQPVYKGVKKFIADTLKPRLRLPSSDSTALQQLILEKTTNPQQPL